MNWAARPRRVAAALTLATAVLAAGCSGDDESAASSSEPTESLVEPSDAPTLQVEPVTTAGKVVGRLPRADRRRVVDNVSHVAVDYLDAAFLSGHYPRKHVKGAFKGSFTRGATLAARRDRGLLTNQGLARRIDGVIPTAIRVRVDLLAVDKHAASSTAHVELTFKTSGRLHRRVRVAGRLLLTKPHGRWQIFGYDLSKGGR